MSELIKGSTERVQKEDEGTARRLREASLSKILNAK